MKRKLMALMLAGIMVIQSAGTSWAAEFTDGVNVEYGDSSENGNEEAFSDNKIEREDSETENFEEEFSDLDTFEQNEIVANIDETYIEEFSEGDGTKNNPYIIYNAYQLNNIRNNLNAYYKLGTNIDLSQFSNWIPIGSSDAPFTGKLDGCGFCISGLTITSCNYLHLGLFGYCNENAILSNINISDANINMVLSDDTIVGTIAGANLGHTNTCSATGEINIKMGTTSYLVIGGISGKGSRIDKCTNRVNININSNGGVSCGGIAGSLGYISHSLNYAKININSYMGEVRGGGISGTEATIEYCENYGNVECTVIGRRSWNSFDRNCNVGGIVGSSCNNISFSNNYGDIYGKTYKDASVCAGGISGLFGYTSFTKTMKNCVNYGNAIVANMEDSYGSAGRITGVLQAGHIERCYSSDTTLVNNVIPTEHIAHNDINGDSINNRKKFELNITEKNPIIFGNQNSISVYFEASTSGNVANEEKAITWKSSNPAIAEIDSNTTSLIDSSDGNSASGWISLLTYDVGEVTITGTTQDGRLQV